MCDMMTFPDTVEDFMEQYKIVDAKQVYTNGAELVPIFRMKQWFEHLQTIEPETEEEAYERGYTAGQMAERKKGKWIYGESECGNDGYYCDKCGNFVPWKYGEYDIDFIKEFLFCNKCGADMREGEQE